MYYIVCNSWNSYIPLNHHAIDIYIGMNHSLFATVYGVYVECIFELPVVPA